MSILVLGLSIYLKYTAGLGSHSGKSTPPLHGDFEAQRHWIEVVSHLPPSEWYTHDLQYWGLDYPPLTAYHSYLIGLFTPEKRWFELGASRGNEELGLVLFMRLSSLLTDLVVFTSAALLYTTIFTPIKFDRTLHLAILLTSPALILIDHAHFQYNSAMLGLVLWSVVLIGDSAYCLAAIAFTLALMFKQMGLYYALPIFCMLFGRVLQKKRYFQYPNQPPSVKLFINLGTSVIATTLLCISPFYADLGQVIHRVFPLARGLFEDKVANFCLLNLSLVLTLLTILPSCIHTLCRPTMRNLHYSLCIAALGFFMFSFQVHEKSILIALMPACLLMGYAGEGAAGMVFNNVGVWTLWPLLRKDGVELQYFAIVGVFNVVCAKLPISCRAQYFLRAHALVLFGLNVAEMRIGKLSERYPDLWVLVNCAVGFAHFVGLFFWYNWRLFSGDMTAVKRTRTGGRSKKQQ